MSANSLNHRILVIDDDEDLAEIVRKHFKFLGYSVEVRYDALGPLSRLRKLEEGGSPWDLILTDLMMPGMDGIDFIKEVHLLFPTLPVILMTAHGGVETAVRAVREGGYDFVMKPLNFAQVAVSVERALGHRKLKEENLALRAVIHDQDGPVIGGTIAKSPGMRTVCDLVARVAPSSATILISGESGSGKEVIAKRIHESGGRKEKPFVAINCAAIPETLLESELFGFAKGSFTGANQEKLGLFEEAEGGTLFLDEIGDLGGMLQAKLLRVLQEKQIKRIGENQPRDVDVRIIAATHRNLEFEVREGRFREDLFFRLNVIPIRIPPLRERQEDIIPLAEHFLKKYALMNQSSVSGFTKDALEYLTLAPWKGNVRELENAIERAVVLCQGTKISKVELALFPQPNLGAGTVASNEVTPSLPAAPKAVSELTPKLLNEILGDFPDEKLPTLEDWKAIYIQFVVDKSHGVREKARRILDIDRKTLYKRLDQSIRLASSASN